MVSMAGRGGRFARPNSCSHVSVHADVAIEIDSEIPSSSDRLHRSGRNLVLTASR